MDIFENRNKTIKLLNDANKEYRERGTFFAATEKDYRVALAKEILTLRADGNPVTIISDLARGQETVALLKQQRDNAEVLYRSAGEAINSYKLQLKLVESQIERDWAQAKRM